MSLNYFIYYLDRLCLNSLKFRVVAVLKAKGTSTVQVLNVAESTKEKVSMFPFKGLSLCLTPTSIYIIGISTAITESVVLYHMGVESAQVNRVVKLVLECGGRVDGLAKVKFRVVRQYTTSESQLSELKAASFRP
jgi:hypothetical protein